MFARTQRLTLRPGWPEDAPALARAIGHESVVTKLARAPWPYREEDARDFLALPASPRGARLLIWAHDAAGEPRLVGGIALEPDGDAAEFGYWLTPDAWGRGYATEAGRAVIAVARHSLPLRRLTAGWFVDNPASGRVLAKLGFRSIGRRWTHSLGRGHPVESVKVELVLDGDGDAEPDRMAPSQLLSPLFQPTAGPCPSPPCPFVAA